MSEIIVRNITPPSNNEPVTITGSKTIRLNFLEHHFGKKIDISKLCSIHPNNNNPQEISMYDIVLDEESNVLSIPTPSKTINFQGQPSQEVGISLYRYPVNNFNITTVWQDVPVSLNMTSGQFELMVRVVDPNNDVGYYSSSIPFMSEQEQPVRVDSTTNIPLFHQGNDTSILELRIVRTTGSIPGSKLQIRGSLALGNPHQSIVLTFKRNFWGL